MFVIFAEFAVPRLTKPLHSIHLVHDDAKDKEFELELSWIGDETNGLHVPVPNDLFEEADKKGRDALDEDMED